MTNSASLDGPAVQNSVSELLRAPESEQEARGYVDTLREIRQQPATLRLTGDCMLPWAHALKRHLSGTRSLLLTGSGSSEYAGECVRYALQNELQVSCETIASGTILTNGSKAFAPERPALMLSFARSGDSPESAAVVSQLLETEPEIRHLILTCNRKGKLAEAFRNHPRVQTIVLDERTNDRSLVMTSSFTSLVIAARFLGFLDRPDEYRTLCKRLVKSVQHVIYRHSETLAQVATAKFTRVVFLASGVRVGAAREAALKMLEMTAGRVSTMHETYLGLRHGPMSYIHSDSLVVCFLSFDPVARAYEIDLLRELDRKQLGLLKLIAGESIPADLPQASDVAIECAGRHELGDENTCIVDVVVGQLLAFFRCLQERLRPDSPSESGVIQRVVENFRLHPLDRQL